ncbi:MAG: hypothetical protein JNM80_13010 [Phycisphaerae bacterium]|nr:hypothetical protein [Phycisphaerae bacterium]
MGSERQILLITGTHPDAERTDRAIAYGLRERVAGWLSRHGERAEVLVCSDVWYLNHDEMRARPTISVGGPGVNALAAFFADKLPSTLAVDGVFLVQADPEFDEPVASCWGSTAGGTAAAVEAFVERYLDGFMRAACRSMGE